MLNLRFIGAAQTTTGSMHAVEYNGHRILLDCGLLQGHRKESFEANRAMPFPPHEIDAIILSHAHIDHSGRLPAFVRAGYKGPIYTTPATKELCDILLRDSAFLQERDVEYVNKKRIRQGKNPFELLYDQKDVENTISLMRPIPYGEVFSPVPGLDLKATFYDAGHILGSASIALDYQKFGKSRRLLFSGDIGQWNTPFLRDPEPVPNVDVLITESTYGDRDHPSRENIQGRIKDYVSFICQHKSKLIIPSFAVGRTQQLLWIVHQLTRKGAIPNIPFYVDSPLSAKATDITRRYTNLFNEKTQEIVARGEDPFDFPNLHFTQTVEDSMALNSIKGPIVIISASGMCEGGRILHHLKNNIQDPLNLVLITGFQAENTLGRRLVEGATPVKIYGDEYDLRATVFTINGLSAHADRQGLIRYAKALGPSVRRAFCVHGEPEFCLANQKNLVEEVGIRRVDIPVRGQLFEDV